MPRFVHSAAMLLCAFAGACGPTAIGVALGRSGGDESGGPTPLELTLVSGPPQATSASSATFEFRSNLVGVRFPGRLDGESLGDLESPHTIEGVRRGPHEFLLTAIAPDGQMQSARYQWVMDPDPPVTTFASTPPRYSASRRAVFELRAEQGSSFDVRLDGLGEFERLGSTTATFDGLTEAVHSLEVRATDPAGNVETPVTTFEWTVDLTAPPPPTGVLVTPRGASTLELQWLAALDPGPAASGTASYRAYYGLDRTYSGTTARGGISPIDVGATLQSALEGLESCREHWVTVRSVDRAGNEGPIGSEFLVRTGCGGTGEFGPPSYFAVGMSPRDAEVIDLDGDGRPEIVVVNALSRDVSLLRNRGDGTFDLAGTFPVQLDGEPRSIAVDDMNLDGIVDLIVGSYVDAQGGNTLQPMRGTGSNGIWDGGFEPRVPPLQGPRRLQDLRFADLLESASKRFELLVLADQRIEVYEGGPLSGLVFIWYPVAVCAPVVRPFATLGAFDLDGDGDVDIPASTVDGRLTALLDIGHSRGAIQLCGSVFAAGDRPTSLTASDLNGDRIPDIVVASEARGGLDVMLGQGSGLFEPPTAYPTGPGPIAVVMADLDDDGIPDTVTAHADGSIVTRLGIGRDGHGDGTLGDAHGFAIGSGAGSVATADLNGDRIDDLVVTEPAGNRVAVMLGRGRTMSWDRTFRAPRAVDAGVGPERLVLSDLDRDGICDVVQLNPDSRTLTAQMGLGNDARGLGSFGRPTITPIVPSQGNNPGPPDDYRLVDIDDDGILDALVTKRSDDTVEIDVLIGQGADRRGDGTFRLRESIPTGQLESCAGFIAAVDLDDDARVDIAYVNCARLRVHRQRTGGFVHGPDVLPPFGARAIEHGDFDGDGDQDIVVLGESEIAMFRNDGAGSLSPDTVLTHDGSATAVSVRDLDGDSVPDLLLLAPPGVRVRLGRGDIGGLLAFGPEVSYPAADTVTLGSMALADLDEDGALDLVISHGDVLDPGFSVLLGRGDGSLAAPLSFRRDPDHVAGSIAIGDLDSDQVLDLIVGDPTGTSLVVYPGGGRPR